MKKSIIFTFCTLVLLLSARGNTVLIPKDNPVAKYGIDWTSKFKWNNVVSIEDIEGDCLLERLDIAQKKLNKKGGGVIFFPEGTYYFPDHLLLEPGIVLRGTNPLNSEKYNPVVKDEYPEAFTDAREPRYKLGTHFVFPSYQHVRSNSSKLKKQSFKGIRMKDSQNGHLNGVVNIEIEHGHISLGSAEDLKNNSIKGIDNGQILVFGCILKNAAVAGAEIPQYFQDPWQIWVDREYGAITVYASRDILIANNRIPKGEPADFLMKGYKVHKNKENFLQGKSPELVDVWFDYNNRTGIRVNFLPMLKELEIWDIYDEIQKSIEKGEVNKHITPGTLAKGIVIRNNFVYTTGGGGIKTTGDGAYVGFNIIRCEPSVVRTTATGLYMDAHVNDVRGIEMRGWYWTVEGNDYDVHSNYTPDGIKYNDGEGIMHEAWENVGIRGSKVINNIGNRYICFWRVPVRGLIIEGNQTRIKPNWHSVFVNAQTRYSPDELIDLPCDDVVVEDNITEGGGIKILGKSSGQHIVKNNRHIVTDEGKIETNGRCFLEGNVDYQIVDVLD